MFDIQQGVSIILGVRTRETRGVGTVRRADLFGSRSTKYDWLEAHDVTTTNWKTIVLREPLYLFAEKDFTMEAEYSTGISLADLFPENVTGIVTARDGLVIDQQRSVLLERIRRFCDLTIPDSQLRAELFPERRPGKYLPGDSRGWKMEQARKLIQAEDHDMRIVPISYRPFDSRWIYYHPKMVDWGRESVMHSMTGNSNVAFVYMRQATDEDYSFVLATNAIADNRYFYSNRGIMSYAPLYLYSDSPTVSGQARTANLNLELLLPALKKLKLEWAPDGTGDGKKTCGPEDGFDYVYAVLHSPTYRARYKEFLKIDFPRVPFTGNAALFWKLVALGRELRSLHLLESPATSKVRTSYLVAGSDTIEKVGFDGKETGKVWINASQYFGDVPRVAWEFYIGGYQPAQKWLKDRKGRTLSGDDILHYQRMIVALCETERLMKEIDAAIGDAGGWPME